MAPMRHADGWNHSAHYHRLLLSAVPRPCARALDVGCGVGSFARRLAKDAVHVDALDRDRDVLGHARALSADIRNLTFIDADFLDWNAGNTYQFIAFVATLHHLPFEMAITKAVALLEPGGTLAVLGLDRKPFLQMAVQATIALPVSCFHRMTRPVAGVHAPLTDPSMTIAEIRRAASAIVPGASIRRHLLWRHSLIWTKPA